MQRQVQTYSTTSLALAAALLSVGIPFNAELPFIKSRSVKGETYTFLFEGTSNCGTYSTSALLKAWDNPKFHEENPEHPFAFVKCAFANREALLDLTKQGTALVVVERNGKLAVLPENASAALQTQIFSKL